MKQTIVCLLGIIGIAVSANAQYAASASGSSTAAAEINGKSNFQIVIGPPTSLACTAGKDFAYNSTSLILYYCSVTGTPGTWVSVSPSGADISTSGLVTRINGTTVPTNSAADQVLRTTGSATATWAAVPDCVTSGHALAYSTSTHTYSCQTISGGSATSVFTGSTASTSAFSATPTFSLADVSVKSPTRFEPGALTANVTGVTFSNKSAGAKFSIAWLQDGTGTRTVSYGASATNTCAVSPTAGSTTTQMFEVAADGSTVVGAGCTSDEAVERGDEVSAPGTPASGIACWRDSTDHNYECINSSGTVFKMARYVTGTGTIDFASISDGACLASTFSLSGVTAGDPLIPKWPSTLETGLFGSMVATATNTVQVRLCNLSGAAVDPASQSFGASVAK